MSCFKNALIFGDKNFSSGNHFTKESRQKATSEKLELEALQPEAILACKTKGYNKYMYIRFLNLLYRCKVFQFWLFW